MPPAVSTSRPTPECVPQPRLEVELMLADQLDYVVGVDPHRDSHALAVVHVASGAIVFEATVVANSDGYANALKIVGEHASGRRAFAVEGTGSFGAGLTRFLTDHDEQVLEVSRLRRERRSGGKTDALDAIRAARSVVTQGRLAKPRAGGERQTRRALPAAGPADHDPGAAAERAAAADTCTALATPGSNPATQPTRCRAAREHARASLDRPPRPATDRRGTRTRPRDRNDHAQTRPPAARPARRRPHAAAQLVLS